jgi:hypothetical protein
MTPLEVGFSPTAYCSSLSKDLSVGFRRLYAANLSRKNPRSGSESLRSDAVAMQELGSAPRYPKPFVRFWHQVCCLPVTSIQSIATASYVASKEEGTDCSLALFGNFTYAELHPCETLLSAPSLCWHLCDVNVQHLGKRDGSTAPGGSSALYSSCSVRLNCRSIVVPYLESFECTLSSP